MNQNFIKAVQEIANNAWPASYSYLMDGWIVRFNKGVTYRANSVLPLNWWGEDLFSSVKTVEEKYHQSQLPSIFMLHDNHEPKGLESLLIDRFYEKIMPTFVMGIEATKIPTIEENADFNYKYTETRLPIWYPALEKLSPWRTLEKLVVIGEIIDRVAIPQKRFFFTEHNQKIVGVMLAIIDGKFMGFLNLAVDENYKRKGVATNLVKKAVNWAVSKKVNSIYLQVEKKNIPAVELYKKLGFKEWYSYRYYEKKFYE
ncbi:MAG: GNAT family N-acetyltransferase [Candidatus Hodarchaeales archaeon]